MDSLPSSPSSAVLSSVEAWGAVAQRAGMRGRSWKHQRVEDEHYAQARERWIAVVGDAHGPEAAQVFAEVADAYVEAREQRGAADHRGWRVNRHFGRELAQGAQASVDEARAVLRAWLAAPAGPGSPLGDGGLGEFPSGEWASRGRETI